MAMPMRDLGKTGLRVSALGLGCGMLGSTNTEYAVRMVQRALDLGVNFIDTARGYRDAERKLGLALKGQRQHAVVSTKTGAKTRDEAWRDINQSLERMQTDYLDNCHLHGLANLADIDARTSVGGALEAFLQAREQGLIRHIGCTSHHSAVLIEALQRFDFEIILVPMNIVEREPLDRLIPLCRERGVGVTIMKPLATGLLPAPLALRWLLDQPVDCIVPGVTTLAEVEEDFALGHAAPAPSVAEQAAIAQLRQELDHVRCRACTDCLPCPQVIDVSLVLGTDVMYDHYRTMGAAGFRSLPWSRPAIERDLPTRLKRIAAIESCTRCGDCERGCPYGLPAMDMLQATLPAMRDMVRAYEEILASPAVVS